MNNAAFFEQYDENVLTHILSFLVHPVPLPINKRFYHLDKTIARPKCIELLKHKYKFSVAQAFENNDDEAVCFMLSHYPMHFYFGTETKYTGGLSYWWGTQEFLILFGEHAAAVGREKIVLFILKVTQKAMPKGRYLGEYMNVLTRINSKALQSGHFELAFLLFDMGADNFNAAFYNAAKYGNEDVLYKLNKMCPDGVNWFIAARGSIDGGHLNLLLDIINKGQMDVHALASTAVTFRQHKIVFELVKRWGIDKYLPRVDILKLITQYIITDQPEYASKLKEFGNKYTWIADKIKQ